MAAQEDRGVRRALAAVAAAATAATQVAAAGRNPKAERAAAIVKAVSVSETETARGLNAERAEGGRA